MKDDKMGGACTIVEEIRNIGLHIFSVRKREGKKLERIMLNRY
jgi:hypothetical protein